MRAAANQNEAGEPVGALNPVQRPISGSAPRETPQAVAPAHLLRGEVDPGGVARLLSHRLKSGRTGRIGAHDSPEPPQARPTHVIHAQEPAR